MQAFRVIVAPRTSYETGMPPMETTTCANPCDWKHTHTELASAHARLAAYAVEVEEITLTNERQRIARELHDTLAQGLAGLIMQLEAVDARLAKGNAEKAREIVQQALVRARATFGDARLAINDLRTRSDEDDLYQAVAVEISRFTTATSIPCNAEIALLAQIPVELRAHARRAITEGLSNIARHAQACRCDVSIYCRDDMYIVEVCDDGIGFDPDRIAIHAGHYGLLGLRERARMVHGHLEITSEKGVGTTLRLYLPREARGGTNE